MAKQANAGGAWHPSLFVDLVKSTQASTTSFSTLESLVQVFQATEGE
jgi:hypothetical protein